MICQNCGAGISDNSNFCTYCGSAMSEMAEGGQQTAEFFAGTPAPPRSLDLGKLLGDTFELYKQHFGTMCLIGVLFCGIPYLFSIFGSLSQFAASAIGGAGGPIPLVVTLWGLYLLMVLCQVFSQWYLMLGAIRQCLYVARGGVGFRADLMFSPVMMFLKMAGLMLIIVLVIYALILPGMIPFIAGLFMLDARGFDPSTAVIMIALSVPVMLLGFCAAIWVGIRWYLAYVFLADQNTGVTDSMRYSWRVTLGNFWILLLASIVLGICSVVGMILCCVGMVLTVAISWLGAALAYLQLTGQPNCLDYAAMQSPLTEPEPPSEPEMPTEPEA